MNDLVARSPVELPFPDFKSCDVEHDDIYCLTCGYWYGSESTVAHDGCKEYLSVVSGTESSSQPDNTDGTKTQETNSGGVGFSAGFSEANLARITHQNQLSNATELNDLRLEMEEKNMEIIDEFRETISSLEGRLKVEGRLISSLEGRLKAIEQQQQQLPPPQQQQQQQQLPPPQLQQQQQQLPPPQQQQQQQQVLPVQVTAAADKTDERNSKRKEVEEVKSEEEVEMVWMVKCISAACPARGTKRQFLRNRRGIGGHRNANKLLNVAHDDNCFEDGDFTEERRACLSD
jgi:hypothetical protein